MAVALNCKILSDSCRSTSIFSFCTVLNPAANPANPADFFFHRLDSAATQLFIQWIPIQPEKNGAFGSKKKIGWIGEKKKKAFGS